MRQLQETDFVKRMATVRKTHENRTIERQAIADYTLYVLQRAESVGHVSFTVRSDSAVIQGDN